MNDDDCGGSSFSNCLALSPHGPPHMGGCVVAPVGAMWDLSSDHRFFRQVAESRYSVRTASQISTVKHASKELKADREVVCAAVHWDFFSCKQGSHWKLTQLRSTGVCSATMQGNILPLTFFKHHHHHHSHCQCQQIKNYLESMLLLVVHWADQWALGSIICAWGDWCDGYRALASNEEGSS